MKKLFWIGLFCYGCYFGATHKDTIAKFVNVTSLKTQEVTKKPRVDLSGGSFSRDSGEQ